MNRRRVSSSLVASTRAELLRLTGWPVLWVLLGVGLTLDILFGYVFNYLSYRSRRDSAITEGLSAERLLDSLSPAGVPEITVQGAPLFGGAILLILGALAVGSGYPWGTWKTVFALAPGRRVAYAGTLTALAVVILGLAAVTLLVNAGAAALVAGLESQPLAWPAPAAVARAFGGVVLIFGMWTAAGVLTGTIVRSPAPAVGLGLVWSLVVENLVRGVGDAVAPLSVVADLLPGTAAGSLAGALGARPFGRDGTPGVLSTLAGDDATLLLVGYTVVFAVVAGVLVARREVR